MNIDDQKSWEDVMQQNKLNVQMPNSAYAPSTTNSYQLTPNAEGGYDDSSINAYKAYLRSLPEVQNMTGEIDVQNPNSIILFGQEASRCISQISDEILANMKAVQSEEASEMLVALTKIMEKFDFDELKNAGTEEPSFFDKLFKKAGETIAKLFQKYDTMGMEVEKIYALLKKYEANIKESNMYLKKLYEGNIYFHQILEKYIVAGEIALEEIDQYMDYFTRDQTMSENERNMMLNQLTVCKEMLSQRVYDLQIAENVALQTAPMIQTMQVSNFNLLRKINSAFIITMPIFKQCLAQAVMLKRQEIQAKSIKQLDDKTNELLARNAQATANQSVNIAKMASGSSIQIETLEKTYSTIMNGIEETKQITEQNAQQRKENARKLEQIKYELLKNQ